MSSKKRKALHRALLGAAATALTVKGALSGPLGAATEMSLASAKEGMLPAPTSVAPGDGKSATPRQATSTSAQAVPAIPTDTPQQIRRASSKTMVRTILRDAALRHGLDPRLVLALSYWESGWDQSRVSETGAVGVMQVEPVTAAEAGPALLGRPVDLADPYDNAEVGVAIFDQYLKAFGSPSQALAAYYQGPTSLRTDGMLPDTQAYVDGILELAARMNPQGTIAQ